MKWVKALQDTFEMCKLGHFTLAQCLKYNAHGRALI